MEPIELLRTVKMRAVEFNVRFAGDPAIETILKQLDFLIELTEGKRSDGERLNDIIIGVLTVREIEPLDEGLADELYKVVEVVEEMKRARAVNRG